VNILLPVKQYYLQRDSDTAHGERMCFSSTVAMAIKFLQPDSLKGSNADDTYLRTVLKFGDTTEYLSHTRAAREYGVTASFYQNGTKATLEKELSAGYPVACGVLHKGPANAPKGGGHWMLVIGITDTHVICHDPYGEMDNVNGGYPRPGVGGKEVSYSWKNWSRRWMVEGNGTGWYMTFRGTPSKPSTAVFENSWSGVKAAATQAGAKFPEVVAAQWALESGYGKHTSGKHNYFGIKDKPGNGTLVKTSEFVSGMEITVDAWFRNYGSLLECVQDLVNKWYKDYKGYRGVNRAKSAEECCRLLQKEGYATDPAYPQKLIKLLRENN
jgi:hypothetical protein